MGDVPDAASVGHTYDGGGATGHARIHRVAQAEPCPHSSAGCCLTSYVVPGLALALLLTAAVGLPTAGIGVGCTTLLRTAVADEYRGRVFGAFGVTGALAMLVGAGLGECWATCLAS